MKCFKHSQSDAVGTCKNCQKGLCHECAVDVGNGIACKSGCEDRVIAINELIDRNMGTHQKIRQVYSRNAAIGTLAGLLLLVIGLADPRFTSFFVPMGIIVLLFSAVSYFAGRKFTQK